MRVSGAAGGDEMSNIRNDTLKKRLLRQVSACELCGNTRNLEVHHIIPIMFQTPAVNLDVEDNMIVLCKKCHGMLTPKGILTKLGMHRKFVAEPLIRFYKAIEDEEGYLDACDVVDLAHQMAEEYIELLKGR